MKKNVIYYKDELNDEFSIPIIKSRIIDGNYKYEHNCIWNGISLILQNFLTMPIKVLYPKIRFKLEYVGKDKFKKYKKDGYFIYANHTQPFADTLIPSIANYPKRNFLIVNPVNISLKGTRTFVEMLGAIPVPGDIKASRNFLKVIEKKIKNGNSITIYPEAHIWPYYTKIRPFKSVSFKYPVKLNVPCFSITNTYQKYGKNNKIKIITYVDGPFFANRKLNYKEQQEDLRNRVYEQMVKRSQNSNIEKIKYIKKEG